MTPSPDDIAQLAGARVLVLGDVMLDHYVSGRVSRVSEEAPVPIIHVADERWTPGGAANVAANIAALGGEVVLAGVVGDDHAAGQLAHLLGAISGVETHLVRQPRRPTTIKTRYMGGQHQIVRVDREQAHPVTHDTEDALLAAVAEAMRGCRAIVLSDYAKGALTPRVLQGAIRSARDAGLAVIVDPKRADWALYAGANLITPNRRELNLATGASCGTDADCAFAAGIAIKATGAAILLTRSEHGMSLFRSDDQPLHLATKAREVFDVSGAGDTVAAAVSLGLAAGLAAETAMAIANIAAGVVVAKRGTATASPEEIVAELGPERAPAAALDLPELIALRRRWGEEGRTVGFTNGCFDILHAGHVALIAQAAAACDRLIVALNTDASVKRLKGPSRPAQNEATRAAVMAALRGVDAVTLFSEETPLDLIRALEPDVLVKGADYAEEQIVGADIVRARGGRIVRAQLSPGQSTTSVLERVKTSSEG